MWKKLIKFVGMFFPKNKRGVWAWPVIAGLGAAGGYGLSKLIGGGSDEEQDIQTISTLSPEQQALLGPYASFLQSRVGQGLPGYTGQLTAGMTPQQTSALSMLSSYLQGTPDIQTFGLEQYKNALAGMDPTETANWYREYMLPEQKRLQEEEVIPGVREAYAGPLSAYYSEPRMGAEARSWGKYGTERGAELGEAIMSERAGARSLLPYLTQMSALQGGMPQIEAGMQYGEVARQIQQQELTAKFEEFKRTTPELSPVIDMIQNLLNIQTMAAFGPGGAAPTASPFAQLLGPVAQYLGAYAGSKTPTPAPTWGPSPATLAG